MGLSTVHCESGSGITRGGGVGVATARPGFWFSELIKFLKQISRNAPKITGPYASPGCILWPVITSQEGPLKNKLNGLKKKKKACWVNFFSIDEDVDSCAASSVTPTGFSVGKSASSSINKKR